MELPLRHSVGWYKSAFVNMDEQKIRQIVQDELRRGTNGGRFGLNTIPFHTHDGVNSQKIKAENVIPAASVTGTIELATEGATYSLKLNSNFTPQQIVAHGIVTGTYSGSAMRAITWGTAQLTPSFYFQPVDGQLAVVTGNTQYPFPTEMPNGSKPTVPAQSSSYLAVSRGSVANTFALTSENHIVSISGFPTSGEIYARATVVGFTRDEVLVYVPTLDAGWTIFLTFVIT